MEKAKTDKEFLERLREKSPEVLEAEMDFDSAITRIFKPGPKENKKVFISRKTKPRKKLKRKVS